MSLSKPSSPVSGRAQLSATPVSTSSLWGNWRLIWKILIIPLLFVAALIALQQFTNKSIEQLSGDTRVVDLAARQRVLTERFQKEVFLTAQGDQTDWSKTAERFGTTANDLMNGGDVLLNIDTGERGKIPAVTSTELRSQLSQQQQMMRDLQAEAEIFLKSPAGSPERNKARGDMTRTGTELARLSNVTTKQLAKNSEQALRNASLNQQGVALGVGLLGLMASIFVARQITTPLSSVVIRAREIGDGDLRGVPLPVLGTDEVGQLSSAFNTMQQGLRSVAAQSQAAAESLAAAAAEILASAQQQAAGSGEQSAAVQQTTTTMEEISRSGTQIAEKARQVASTAEATSTASEAGLHAVQEASNSMNTIQQQAQTVAENVVMLSEKTRAIGEIISTVNEIAEQSHLLALNAAIEAAGAGEQGRRFSVVADEMKHLADQSRDATVQVRSILGDIQKQIHTSVMVTEESVKRTEDGKRQSDLAEATIRRMSTSIIDSVNAFQQIVAAANQQQIGFEQVTQAAQQIRAAVDQSTVGTRQMETAAVNVSDLSQQLRNAVEVYRL